MSQLWSMTDASAVWAASPALYYASFNELVDAAEAEHGPWPLEDFDAKVVRALGTLISFDRSAAHLVTAMTRAEQHILLWEEICSNHHTTAGLVKRGL